MTLAQTLNAIAEDLASYASTLCADPSPQRQADGQTLTATCETLLTDAMRANALDLESKLAADAQAMQHLKTFTTQARQRAQRLAQQQAAVSHFTTMATQIAKTLTCGAGGDIPGIIGALAAASQALGLA